jgi:hypothetical protein
VLDGGRRFCGLYGRFSGDRSSGVWLTALSDVDSDEYQFTGCGDWYWCAEMPDTTHLPLMTDDCTEHNLGLTCDPIDGMIKTAVAPERPLIAIS